MYPSAPNGEAVRAQARRQEMEDELQLIRLRGEQHASQQQMMDMQMKKGMDMEQFQLWMAKSKEGREWYTAQIAGARLQLDTTDKATDNIREDDKFKHQKEVDFAELKLEQQQKRAAKIGNDS